MARTEQRERNDRRFTTKDGLVASVAYSRDTCFLVVELRAGRGVATYRYKAVEEAVYEQLLEAQSPAKVFADVVRKGSYEYERIPNAF
ncbi:MAG TPA: KTSC domain-containing protein [Dehalococcoidia bacterium]|jgi:hypothetical protein